MDTSTADRDTVRPARNASTGGSVKPFVMCCPGCKTEFRCGVATVPFACDCQNVRLTPDEQTSIRERFGTQCLCAACLRQKGQTRV